MTTRYPLCFSSALTREADTDPRIRAGRGGSHPLSLPHQRHCLLQGENSWDLLHQRTGCTTPVTVTSLDLASETCVCSHSLFYEACPPPEIILMCNSKRYELPLRAARVLYFYSPRATDYPATRYIIFKIISTTKTPPTTGVTACIAPSRQHPHQTSTIMANISERRKL